jgi:transposase-like protein
MPKNNQQKYIHNTLKYLLYNKYFDILKKVRYTKKQFDADFPDDDTCLDTIFQERYGDVKDCPRCGVIDTKFYRVTGRKCYACMHCGYQLHPLAQTIFHKSSTSLKDWFYAIYLFSVSKNGVAAKELERHLGVTYKTAHRMARQIRSLMSSEGADVIGGFGTTVEADETYIGGKRRTGRKGTHGKIPVLGVVERGGEVRAKVSDTASTRRAKAFLSTTVHIDSLLNTDESRIYLWARKYGLKHESINHSTGEYARGRVTTNTIEGFWGQMKRSIDGTYHCVSRKYLQQYVDEFAWRYSHRGVIAYPALLELASMRVG